MKYLKKFVTEEDKTLWRIGNEHVLPNVCLTDEKINYNLSKFVAGVSIQHINGDLYTVEDWTQKGFSNEEANGVAYLDASGSIKIIIAKENAEKYYWSDTSSGTDSIDGVFTAANYSTANTDYGGEENTVKIIANTRSSAALKCANYSAPNGQNGYLGAAGEWATVYSNRIEIDEALILIGGTPLELETNTYWTSTQASSSSAWAKREWAPTSYNKTHPTPITRPFLPFVL